MVLIIEKKHIEHADTVNDTPEAKQRFLMRVKLHCPSFGRAITEAENWYVGHFFGSHLAIDQPEIHQRSMVEDAFQRSISLLLAALEAAHGKMPLIPEELLEDVHEKNCDPELALARYAALRELSEALMTDFCAEAFRFHLCGIETILVLGRSEEPNHTVRGEEPQDGARLCACGVGAVLAFVTVFLKAIERERAAQTGIEMQISASAFYDFIKQMPEEAFLGKKE